MHLICCVSLLFVFSVHARPTFEKAIGGEKEQNQDNLVLVHTVWRHGSRSPLRLFKNDPNTEDTWTFGLGNLLPAGMLDCLKLGRRLRYRYNDFLSPHYNHSEVFIRSSDTNRTLRSALSNMIGFYEEGSRVGIDFPDVQGWPIGYVPVPIHTIKQADDDALVGYTPSNCPRLDKAWNMVVKTPQYVKMLDKYKDTIKEAERVTGDPIDMKVRDGPYYVVDEHFIEKRAKRPLTPGYTDQLYDSLKDLNDEALAYQFGFKLDAQIGLNFHLEMSKPAGSTILWEIIDRMQFKANCYEQQIQNGSVSADCAWISKLKYYGYSAHDSTITSLFATFGFSETNWNKPGYPGYTSCLSFELRKSAQTNEFYLQIFYIVADEPTIDLTQDISGCESSCTLAEFSKRSEIYKIDNKTEYCNSDPGVY